MRRFAIPALVLSACITSLSCQSYTTGLKQSVARADETAAFGAMRTIAVAQRTYSMSNNNEYGTFQQLSEGGYLDSRFSSSNPQIKNYVLTMTVNPKSGSASEGFFSCNADPAGSGAEGRHLYMDSTSSEIHVNPTQPATVNDPIFQP
jgi:hypothetical protein